MTKQPLGSDRGVISVVNWQVIGLSSMMTKEGDSLTYILMYVGVICSIQKNTTYITSVHALNDIHGCIKMENHHSKSIVGIFLTGVGPIGFG